MKHNKLICIFTITLIIETLAIFGLFHKLSKDQIDMNITSKIGRIDEIIHNEIKQQKDILFTTIEAMDFDHETIKLIKNRNKDALYNQYKNFFQDIKSKYGINHFYFHSIDHKNIVRLHNYSLSNDLIDRKSFKSAVNTNQTAYALEQGMSGNITLRIVRPIKENNITIGHIELGTDYPIILDHISKRSSGFYSVLINKNFVKQDMWESRTNKLIGQSKWNDFSDYIIVSSNYKNLGVNQINNIKKSINVESNNPINEFIPRENIFLKSYPIYDQDKIKIGYYLFETNLNNVIDPLFKTFINLAILLMFCTLLLFYFSYKIIADLKHSDDAILTTARLSAVGEMAGHLSHEINNPLTVIIYHAEKLKKLRAKNDLDNAAIDDSLEKITKMSIRITKIIAGIKLSIRNSEKDEFKPESLKTIIEDTLEVCAKKFNDAEIRIDANDVLDLQVLCKASQLSQVILNLLTNAVDAITDKEDKWINIATYIIEGKVVISITDSGNGIPKTIVKKMMEPFFTTKDVHKGTGLGLAISKEIIEKHQGQFYYDENSSNTRFIIEIPNVA